MFQRVKVGLEGASCLSVFWVLGSCSKVVIIGAECGTEGGVKSWVKRLNRRGDKDKMAS